MKKLYVALWGGTAVVDGVKVAIHRGQVAEEGSPILVGRENMFAPFKPDFAAPAEEPKKRGRRVEQATAAPGEERDA